MKKVYYCPKCFEEKSWFAYTSSEGDNPMCKKHNIKKEIQNINVNDLNDIALVTKHDVVFNL